MIKRLTWFVAGVVTGVGAARSARRRVVRTARRLSPVHAAERLRRRAEQGVDTVAGAVREGRLAMANRERELRARLERRVDPIDGRLAEDETLLVDGAPVEPGRVVVMRSERD